MEGGNTVTFCSFAGCFYMCPVEMELVLHFTTRSSSSDLILVLLQSMENNSALQQSLDLKLKTRTRYFIFLLVGFVVVSLLE